MLRTRYDKENLRLPPYATDNTQLKEAENNDYNNFQIGAPGFYYPSQKPCRPYAMRMNIDQLPFAYIWAFQT